MTAGQNCPALAIGTASHKPIKLRVPAVRSYGNRNSYRQLTDDTVLAREKDFSMLETLMAWRKKREERVLQELATQISLDATPVVLRNLPRSLEGMTQAEAKGYLFTICHEVVEKGVDRAWRQTHQLSNEAARKLIDLCREKVAARLVVKQATSPARRTLKAA